MSWLDRCGVYLLSTIHPLRNPDGTLPTVTWKNGREQVDVPCPPAQVSYQKHMGRVDLSDQLIKNFSVIRKSRKAWKKLHCYGLDVCLQDFFIIMRKANPRLKQEFIDYQLKVASQLICQRSFLGRPGWPPSLPLTEKDEKRLNDQKHSVEVTDTRKDCSLCKKGFSLKPWKEPPIQVICCMCYLQPHFFVYQQGQKFLGKMAQWMHLQTMMKIFNILDWISFVLRNFFECSNVKLCILRFWNFWLTKIKKWFSKVVLLYSTWLCYIIIMLSFFLSNLLMFKVTPSNLLTRCK